MASPASQHHSPVIEPLIGLVDSKLNSSLPPIPPAPALVKFDAAFLDRRMREHRDWCEFQERVAAAGIIQEVLSVNEECDDLDS